MRRVSILASLALAACGGSSSGPGNSVDQSEEDVAACGSSSGTLFTNATVAVGLCNDVANDIPADDEMQVMGGGLAMDDIDGDGDLDLYVTYGMHSTGTLYLWQDGRFEAAPGNNGIVPRGLDNAGFFVDIDGDGARDFISIQYEMNFIQVFGNDGSGNFSDITDSTNLFLQKPTFTMAATDYDLDGDVDLFFAHWGPAWREGEPLTEYLWQNNGDGFFTDVSTIVEIKPSFRPPPLDDVEGEHSFTPTFADVNDDGYADLLLAGDFDSSQVLINEGGTAFVDRTTAAISDENGMGATVLDVENDGDLDWFVTSIFFAGRPEDKQYAGGVTGNRLYLNDGEGNFSDATDGAGVRNGAWGWGACSADFDNDGYTDLYHTNGMRSVNSDPNNTFDALYDYFFDHSRLFMSNGDGSFTESAAAAGIDHTGQGRGVVCTDFDADGRVDILVSTNGENPSAYRNTVTNNNHYLQVDLRGAAGNLDAVGARVSVTTGSTTQVRQVVLGSQYLSQAPTLLHFGLGSSDTVETLRVEWPGPGGETTELTNVAADQRIEVAYP